MINILYKAESLNLNTDQKKKKNLKGAQSKELKNTARNRKTSLSNSIYRLILYDEYLGINTLVMTERRVSELGYNPKSYYSPTECRIHYSRTKHQSIKRKGKS